MNQNIGIMGKKVGMTHLYDTKGARRPATVLYTPKCIVTAIRSEEKHGYNALQVAVTSGEPSEKIKDKNSTKSLKTQFKDLGFVPRVVQEFRVSADVLAKYKVGDQIGNEIFEKGQYVDVRGRTIGKGFQGVMKRYKFAGFGATHGSHESFRGGGSIGQRAWPARVMKGRKMAGHMGDRVRSVLNLEVLDVNPQENYVCVSGSVAGASRAWLQVRHAVKG